MDGDACGLSFTSSATREPNGMSNPAQPPWIATGTLHRALAWIAHELGVGKDYSYNCLRRGVHSLQEIICKRR